MRLSPANLNDAKKMARTLCDCLHESGITTNCNDRAAVSPSLQQTQEIMAKALGYSGWRELARLLGNGQKPLYINDLNERDFIRVYGSLVKKLASNLGFDYDSTLVWKVIEDTALGFPPSVRRERREYSIGRRSGLGGDVVCVYTHPPSTTFDRPIMYSLNQTGGLVDLRNSEGNFTFQLDSVNDSVSLRLMVRSLNTSVLSEWIIRVWHGQFADVVVDRFFKNNGAEILDIRFA